MTFISDKHKFIFIEPPKCATGSITHCLREEEPGLLPMGCIDKNKPNRHSLGRIIECSFWSRWQNYYKFAPIRNPWARNVSWLLWSKNKIEEWNKGKKFKPRFKMAMKNLVKFIASHEPEDILKVVIENKVTAQHHYWTDIKGENIIVDKLLRFENIQDEFSDLGKKLGVKNTQLGFVNKTESYDYRAFYTDETIEMVAKKDAKVIEIGGYTFD